MNCRLFSLIAAPAVIAFVVGCAKPSVVGKWQGSVNARGQTFQSTFDLKADNTMTQTVTTPIGPVMATGTWKADGDKLNLKTSDVKVNGKPLPPMFAAAIPKSTFDSTATFKLEGDTLTLTNNGQSTSLTRVKDEAVK